MPGFELQQTAPNKAELFWNVPEAMREAVLESDPVGDYLVERTCSRPYQDGRYYLATIMVENPAKMVEVVREWQCCKKARRVLGERHITRFIA